ncbi:uncharacterized protein LOC111078315 [Drosophila obscura]|uniref:uncharacterized protein LOC111078315 n=1 Tax=Drosophila obscura TaxID=7282 RepID=UPI001BB14245|nr:uncharacterized protein LOC111078315 [Drosophila obscura]
MGFRFIMLAAMGLGAMYMMHLLAQDWNRIRPIQGITTLAGQVSSGLNLNRLPALAGQASAALTRIRGRREAPTYHRARGTGTPDSGRGPYRAPPPAIDWKRILSRDPFECLQSLICQLMSGAEAAAPEAELLMDYLESSLELAPAKIGRAFSRGLALRGSTDRCYNEYPFCLYSAKTMLRILRWFSETGEVPQDMESGQKADD